MKHARRSRRGDAQVRRLWRRHPTGRPHNLFEQLVADAILRNDLVMSRAMPVGSNTIARRRGSTVLLANTCVGAIKPSADLVHVVRGFRMVTVVGASGVLRLHLPILRRYRRRLRQGCFRRVPDLGKMDAVWRLRFFHRRCHYPGFGWRRCRNNRRFDTGKVLLRKIYAEKITVRSFHSSSARATSLISAKNSSSSRRGAPVKCSQTAWELISTRSSSHELPSVRSLPPPQCRRCQEKDTIAMLCGRSAQCRSGSPRGALTVI